MEAMARMKDNEFDLAIVDPPYGIGKFSPDKWTDKKTKKRIPTKKTYNTNESEWNNNIPSIEYFDHLLRISKNQIIWGANYYNCFPQKGGAIIWNKHNPNPKMSMCEIASQSFFKKVDYYSYEWHGIIKESWDGRIHPCEKPVALYKWLLKNYAKEGDRILDTHLGSGSSRMAAYDMGFDFVGYEIDKDYFDAQEKRFNNHIKQQSLFNPKDMY